MNTQNPENLHQKNEKNTKTRIKVCIIKNCEHAKGTSSNIRMFRYMLAV